MKRHKSTPGEPLQRRLGLNSRHSVRPYCESVLDMSYYAAGAPPVNGSPAPVASTSTDLELVAALSSPTTQPALKANGERALFEAYK